MSTPATAPSCHRCGAVLPAGRPSRRDVCASCGSEVRVCLNCSFYSAGAANDCREPQAERVVDKERANFCEFFVLSAAAASPRLGERGDGARAVRDALDALFRKS